VLALFGIGDGAVATGWTLYAPLSVQGGHRCGFRDLLDPHPRHQLDHGLNQRHRHHLQPARAGHDDDEDAALLPGAG
jgi:hypothetical protein